MQKPTKYLLIAGGIGIAVVALLMLTSTSADAATVNLTAKSSAEFDSLIAQAKAYAAQQSGLAQIALNASIALIVSQKAAIVQKAVASGQSVTTMLAPYLKIS